MDTASIRIFNSKKTRWWFFLLFFGLMTAGGPVIMLMEEPFGGLGVFIVGISGALISFNILSDKNPTINIDQSGFTWSLAGKIGPIPWSEISDPKLADKNLVMHVKHRERYYSSSWLSSLVKGDGPISFNLSVIGADPAQIIRVIQTHATADWKKAHQHVAENENAEQEVAGTTSLFSAILSLFVVGMFGVSMWFLMKAWFGGVPSIFQTETQKAFTAAANIVSQELTLPPIEPLYKDIAWKKKDGGVTSYLVVIEFDAKNPMGIGSNGLNYVSNRMCILTYFKLEGGNVYHDNRAGSTWPCKAGSDRKELVTSILEMLGE